MTWSVKSVVIYWWRYNTKSCWSDCKALVVIFLSRNTSLYFLSKFKQSAYKEYSTGMTYVRKNDLKLNAAITQKKEDYADD